MHIHNNLASYLYRYLFLNLYGYLTRHLDRHRYLAGDFDGYHLIVCGTGNAGHDGDETCQNCTAGRPRVHSESAFLLHYCFRCGI